MASPNIIIGPWPNMQKNIGAGGGHSGSGGGGDGVNDVEPRIVALETHIDYFKRDISDIKIASEAIRNDVTTARVQLGQLVERISHLPSKGFIITAVTGALAVLAALIAYQQQIQRLFGLH